MSPFTGEIRQFPEGAEIPDPFIDVSNVKLTLKQQDSQQVSKYDNQSPAGKIFLNARQKRNAAKRERRKKKGK